MSYMCRMAMIRGLNFRSELDRSDLLMGFSEVTEL